MDVAPSALFAGLLVSTVGFVMFRYGKKQGRPPQALTGALLMLFPMFASGAASILLIGAGLVGTLCLLVRLGL